MKNKMIMFCLFLLFFSCDQENLKMADTQELTIKKEVNTAFLQLVESAKSLNVENYLNHFDSDNFIGINGDGTIIRSLSDFRKTYSEGMKYLKSYKSLKFPEVHITVINNITAILVNEFDMVGVSSTGDDFSASGAGTQVWSKKSGTWKRISVSGSHK